MKDAGKVSAVKSNAKPNNTSESSEHSDQNDDTITDKAEEAPGQAIKPDDELCPDDEFEVAPPSNEEKSICTVDFYPIKYKLDRLEEFRGRIEDYFRNRKDVIQKVLKCEVVNYGNNVRLVTEVKVKRGWIFFFCDPEGNYADLEGVRTVRHECQDLSNCDKG